MDTTTSINTTGLAGAIGSSFLCSENSSNSTSVSTARLAEAMGSLSLHSQDGPSSTRCVSTTGVAGITGSVSLHSEGSPSSPSVVTKVATAVIRRRRQNLCLITCGGDFGVGIIDPTRVSLSDILRFTIPHFVNTSKLFQYVGDKASAIERLNRVASNVETEVKLEELASLLNMGPMTMRHPLFSDPDFVDLVVLAYLGNKIGDLQMGTALYWKSALCRFRREPALFLMEVPLFLPTGCINPEARKIMKETVQTLPTQEALQLGLPPAEPVLQDREIEVWFSRMRGEPASEKMLLVGETIGDGIAAMNAYKDSFTNSRMDGQERLRRFKGVYEAGRSKPRSTIMDMMYVSGLNLFNRVGGRNRMFPSMGMAITLFNMKSVRCPLVFQFGGGPLREGGIALESPYQPMPARVIDYAASPCDYTSYNLLFAYFTSLIPVEHRRLFIEAGDVFDAESRKPNADPYMQVFARLCYDADGAVYRPEMKGNFMRVLPALGIREFNDATLFVQSLLGFFVGAIDRRIVSEIQIIYANTDILEEDQDAVASIALEEWGTAIQVEVMNVCNNPLDKLIEHFTNKNANSPLPPFEVRVLKALVEVASLKFPH